MYINKYFINLSMARQSLKKLFFVLLITSSFSSYADNQVFDLGVDVTPNDINNNGTIVGSHKTDSGTIGFRRLQGSSNEDILETTSAYAVNDNEIVVGKTLTGAFQYDGQLKEWDGYGAFGINEAGQISGNKQLKNPYRPTPLPLDPAIYTPKKWNNMNVATVYSRGTRKGVYADLYDLDDINDFGYAVGSRRRYGLVGSSSILTTPQFNKVVYLSTPYGGRATAINNQNNVVGTTGSNSSAGDYAHAFLCDYDDKTGACAVFTDLGTLNNNAGLTSSAADINNSNQVVGSSWLVTQLTSLYDPTQYHAFIWENGVMTDLNDLIPPESGWILTSATAINENGDIVGTGIFDGQVHGFLLTLNN